MEQAQLPAKTALRDQILTARKELTAAELGAASRGLGAHLLALPEVQRAATVTAYVATGSEPGTSFLLDGLVASGRRVLLPVVLPDFDLDWAAYTGDRDLAPTRHRLLEPTGPRLGVDAVATADVVLVPGLAVSSSGLRLGRGAGCYDRALSRVPVGTFTCAVLHDGETDRAVPAEPHDRPVTAAVTPAGGVVRF